MHLLYGWCNPAIMPDGLAFLILLGVRSGLTFLLFSILPFPLDNGVIIGIGLAIPLGWIWSKWTGES